MRGRGVALIAGVSAAVLFVVVAVVVAVSGSGPSTPDGGAGGGAPVAWSPLPAPTGGPATEPPTAGPATTAPAPTVDAQAAALDELRRLHDQDASTVRFNRQFVAQLASKNVGIVDPFQTAADGSHAFRATDILAEHLALRQGDNRGVPVVLLLSTDYGKRQLYQGAPLWVTVALGGFGSAADVNAWCGARFPSLSGTELQNQCASRRLDPPS